MQSRILLFVAIAFTGLALVSSCGSASTITNPSPVVIIVTATPSIVANNSTPSAIQGSEVESFEERVQHLLIAFDQQDVATIQELTDNNMPLRDAEISYALTNWEQYRGASYLAFPERVTGRIRAITVLETKQQGKTTVARVQISFANATTISSISMVKTTEGWKANHWDWDIEVSWAQPTPMPLTQEQQQLGDVLLRFVDSDDQPIFGINVTFSDRDKKLIATVTSDADGLVIYRGTPTPEFLVVSIITNVEQQAIEIPKNMLFRVTDYENKLRVFRIQERVLHEVAQTQLGLVQNVTAVPINVEPSEPGASGSSAAGAIPTNLITAGLATAADEVMEEKDYARVITAEGTITFYKYESQTWKLIAGGTMFDPDSLKKLGIPDSLWP